MLRWSRRTRFGGNAEEGRLPPQIHSPGVPRQEEGPQTIRIAVVPRIEGLQAVAVLRQGTSPIPEVVDQDHWVDFGHDPGKPPELRAETISRSSVNAGKDNSATAAEPPMGPYQAAIQSRTEEMRIAETADAAKALEVRLMRDLQQRKSCRDEDAQEGSDEHLERRVPLNLLHRMICYAETLRASFPS
jgi:hypothetical protein